MYTLLLTRQNAPSGAKSNTETYWFSYSDLNEALACFHQKATDALISKDYFFIIQLLDENYNQIKVEYNKHENLQ